MTRNFRPLGDWFSRDETAARLSQSVIEQESYAPILANLLHQSEAEISARCRLLRPEVNRLLLITNSPHYALRLRHRRPALEAALQQSGLLFKTLRIRVMPNTLLKDEYRHGEHKYSTESVRSVNALADNLPKGELKQALEKLGKRLKNRASPGSQNNH